ncbi:putative Light-regulated protein precursor [Tripterygium wilfordii]|uniref:Putative Light-regulated protein n=2 Tax=Tripterygium wilfordii TaxID=458696 RepID=A0A7J7DJB2_TRIWF|nr:putative Light-regulated protein precursor [Tripterygium wilfordii]
MYSLKLQFHCNSAKKKDQIQTEAISKMQVAMNLVSPPLSIVIPTKPSLPLKSIARIQGRQFPQIRAAEVEPDTTTVDYSSMTSVFPAEACETIGGEACDVEMYPETKLKPETVNTVPKPASEQVEREYIDYKNPKTVFLEEACDDLGGEFCDPEYQGKGN